MTENCAATESHTKLQFFLPCTSFILTSNSTFDKIKVKRVNPIVTVRHNQELETPILYLL